MDGSVEEKESLSLTLEEMQREKAELVLKMREELKKCKAYGKALDLFKTYAVAGGDPEFDRYRLHTRAKPDESIAKDIWDGRVQWLSEEVAVAFGRLCRQRFPGVPDCGYGFNTAQSLGRDPFVEANKDKYHKFEKTIRDFIVLNGDKTLKSEIRIEWMEGGDTAIGNEEEVAEELTLSSHESDSDSDIVTPVPRLRVDADLDLDGDVAMDNSSTVANAKDSALATDSALAVQRSTAVPLPVAVVMEADTEEMDSKMDSKMDEDNIAFGSTVDAALQHSAADSGNGLSVMTARQMPEPMRSLKPIMCEPRHASYTHAQAFLTCKCERVGGNKLENWHLPEFEVRAKVDIPAHVCVARYLAYEYLTEEFDAIYQRTNSERKADLYALPRVARVCGQPHKIMLDGYSVLCNSRNDQLLSDVHLHIQHSSYVSPQMDAIKGRDEGEHSCNSVHMVHAEIDGWPAVFFITRVPVRAGELLVTYSDNMQRTLRDYMSDLQVIPTCKLALAKHMEAKGISERVVDALKSAMCE